MSSVEQAASEIYDTKTTANGLKDGVILQNNYPTMLQKYTSRRWRLAYLLVMACVLGQSMEYCMNFAVVCMTRDVTADVGYDLNYTDGHQCNSSVIQSTSTPSTRSIAKVVLGEFDYSSEIQGLLISSPFYTSTISPFVGSVAPRRFGAKIVISLGVLVSGTTTVLFPLAARTHIYLAVVCRLCIGFCLGFILTATLELCLHWSPSHETQQIIALCFAGYSMANIVTFSLCGYLCLIPIDNGWPFIFYVFGGCAILWALTWMYVATNTPEKNTRISPEELTYIKTHRTGPDNRRDRKIPWLTFVRSKSVWAYLAVFVTHNLNSTVIFSYLPSYMDTVLQFDIDENGLLSSLPSATRLIGTLIWSFISVRLQRVTSTTFTRKTTQSAGFLLAAVLTVCLCYLTEGQEYVAVALIAGVTMFHSVSAVAGSVNPVDLAPQYASFISSVGMTSAFISMSLGPMVVSYLIPERTREQFATVFYIIAAVYVVAALIFVFFGSGEIQPWAQNSDRITDLEIAESSTKGEVNSAYVSDMAGSVQGAVAGADGMGIGRGGDGAVRITPVK
ncbi:uncharacterized transporter slc-17.2-like [Haliotis asinina]|uniref:uncharacterized transporter slc-17.2-like n=1 Tax=Haliotis asinina TaxID=109174 RepID=UPI0035318CC8